MSVPASCFACTKAEAEAGHGPPGTGIVNPPAELCGTVSEKMMYCVAADCPLGINWIVTKRSVVVFVLTSVIPCTFAPPEIAFALKVTTVV